MDALHNVGTWCTVWECGDVHQIYAALHINGKAHPTEFFPTSCLLLITLYLLRKRTKGVPIYSFWRARQKFIRFNAPCRLCWSLLSEICVRKFPSFFCRGPVYRKAQSVALPYTVYKKPNKENTFGLLSEGAPWVCLTYMLGAQTRMHRALVMLDPGYGFPVCL